MSDEITTRDMDLPNLPTHESLDTRVLPNVLCNQAAAEFGAIVDRLNRELAGRRIRITSDYNGQVIGSSRPSMTGRIMTINRVGIGHYLDRYSVYVFVDGQRVSLWAHEFEFTEQPS